jgi:hypothetical protein
VAQKRIPKKASIGAKSRPVQTLQMGPMHALHHPWVEQTMLLLPCVEHLAILTISSYCLSHTTMACQNQSRENKRIFFTKNIALLLEKCIQREKKT